MHDSHKLKADNRILAYENAFAITVYIVFITVYIVELTNN